MNFINSSFTDEGKTRFGMGTFKRASGFICQLSQPRRWPVVSTKINLEAQNSSKTDFQHSFTLSNVPLAQWIQAQAAPEFIACTDCKNHSVFKLLWIKTFALIYFGLIVSASVQAQFVPEPWNGTRDKSCEAYHSAKYKTPIYSEKAINDHLISVLAVNNSPKLFYRWEQPVRYYLEVPPGYPELTKLFEEQVAQVAKYTGLDIARHDKPYLAYKPDKLNDKTKWPDGKSTNAVIVWTLEMEKSLRTPLVDSLNTGFGTDIERAQGQWQSLKQRSMKDSDSNAPINSGYVGFDQYGFDPDGMKFALLIYEPKHEIKIRLRANPQILQRPMLRVTGTQLVTMSFGAPHVASIIDAQAPQLTDFDKQFLRVLYGKHVHSGMLLIKAKRLMLEELVDCFNAKAGTVKK